MVNWSEFWFYYKLIFQSTAFFFVLSISILFKAMLNTRFFLIGALLFLFLNVSAQKTDIGLNLYGTNYVGDFTDNFSDRDIASYPLYLVQTSRFGFGGHVRYRLTDQLSARGNVNFIRIENADSLSDLNKKIVRNLSFRNDIIEFNALLEYQFRPTGTLRNEYKSSPFVSAGIGLIRHNPKARIGDEWYALQPLGTEGQGLFNYPTREEYSLSQLVIPLGVGWRFIFNDYWAMAIELNYRHTFTDYLDDISKSYVDNAQLLATNGAISAALADRTPERFGDFSPNPEGTVRGNETETDIFYYVGVSLSYTIWRKTCPSFNNVRRK